jgi:phosphatidylinositol dimannoside acyltransferase
MSSKTPVAGAHASTQEPRRNRRWVALRRQLAECVLLPAIGAALPWPLAWRVLRALAGRTRFFDDETTRAQRTCDAQRFVDDPASWSRRHRLTRMIDQADAAISATRGDRWMIRHLVVEGDPVPAGPCVFVGFHYGTGFWSLRHLRGLGHAVSFLSAPIEAAQWRAEPLRLAFMRWRQKRVADAGGAPIIYVGGSTDTIRASLRAGTSVLALIDVPESTTTTVTVRLLGHDVQFPDGILRIGAAERVPLIGYVASLDARDGTRHLRFTRLPDDPAAALHALAAMLDAAIRRDPAAWHFWAEWPRFAKRVPSAATGESGIAGLR